MTAPDPAQPLKEFQPRHGFFVGIDSDGCAFDTMEIKHKECFAPNIIKHWDLQAVSKFAREAAEFVNLYSKWRGINRWPALVMGFDLLRERGREYGTTTGRPRRCGWFDGVAMRRAAQINSLSGLCITKLDVLDGLKTLKLATRYRYNGESVDLPPLGADAIEQMALAARRSARFNSPSSVLISVRSWKAISRPSLSLCRSTTPVAE